MREWLSGGLSAARLAADRADLWFPGALVSFAFAGWAVFLAVVISPPDEGDVLYLGIRLASSAWWPWNALALAAAVGAGAGLLLLVISYGEVALLKGLTDPPRADAQTRVPRALGVLGLAAAPIVALIAALLWLVAPTFVDAFGQADPSTPYLLRVLRRAWPLLVVLAAGVVLVQAWGALALRMPLITALRTARLGMRRVVPQAAITSGAYVGMQAATFIALSTLWHPLADRLAQGRLTEPPTAVLLLGFVWMWLVLVIVAGVLQTWITAWWNKTLAQRPGG